MGGTFADECALIIVVGSGVVKQKKSFEKLMAVIISECPLAFMHIQYFSYTLFGVRNNTIAMLIVRCNVYSVYVDEYSVVLGRQETSP